MSAAVKCFLADLFGNEECSDCVVRFSLSKDAADRSLAQPQAPEAALAKQAGARVAEGVNVDPAADVGEPLPAHSWVLRPGSSYFKSQLERWTAEQPAGSKPVLNVPVGHAEDVSHARSAIRFTYTGELGVSSASGLLGMRRLACYLGVEGATEACDVALLSLAKAPSMAGLVELYACRQLLPAWDDDPTAAALVDGLREACQEELVAYKGADTEFNAPGGSGGSSGAAKVPLGEVLAWAFPDAPSVLSDPAAKSRVQALPASSLEALLSCNTFATDNEASVLLLLAEWLDANPSTAADVKKRLSGCIRLCQLSDVYLHGVLPRLPWFPFGAPGTPLRWSLMNTMSHLELPLFFQALKMPEGKGRERLLAYAESSGSAWPPAWTSGPARPCTRADTGRVHEWSVSEADMGMELGKLTETIFLNGSFANGSGHVASNGFTIRPLLQFRCEDNAAGVYLSCDLPASLKILHGSATPRMGLMNPGRCRLATWRWAEGSEGAQRQAAHAFTYGQEQDLIPVGRGWGVAKVMPLLEAPAPSDGAAPDLLARWAPYLHDGKLSGALEWLPGS